RLINLMAKRQKGGDNCRPTFFNSNHRLHSSPSLSTPPPPSTSPPSQSNPNLPRTTP
ncbi:hypothetical protein A2U01_0082750, partial [Trifolium medium]|nr:hypothetical protein [Trifolium medium]